MTFRPARQVLWLLIALYLPLTAASCKGCGDEEEKEERDALRDNYWRAQLSIVGHGSVATRAKTFACTSDGSRQTGRCGPTLLKFKELEPPLMEATAAPGWRFDHWESSTRASDGSVTPRRGPMPDGRFYLNGFGYTDTGALETVTAVFATCQDGCAGAP